MQSHIMTPAKSPKPSKKRSRPAAAAAAAAIAAIDGNAGSSGSYEPLDPADALPGWERLAESLHLLQQCALPTDEQVVALDS